MAIIYIVITSLMNKNWQKCVELSTDRAPEQVVFFTGVVQETALALLSRLKLK